MEFMNDLLPSLMCRLCVLLLCLDFTAIDNLNTLAGGTVRGADSFDILDQFHSFYNLAEDDVFTVQPRRVSSAEEELRTVGVCTRISHGETPWTEVLARLATKAFVLEFVAVDGLATSTVVASEVTPLAHELRDNTMKR